MFSLLPFPDLQHFALFGLVLARTAGIFTAIPGLGGKRVPNNIRAAFIFALTLTLFPVLSLKGVEVPTDTVSLTLLMVREGLVGITLGLVAQTIFAAVDLCGQITGLQMGLTISSQFDPSMGQSSIIAAFQGLLAMLLFFVFDIHHFFIRAIVQSYELLPVGSWHMSNGLMAFLVAALGTVFVLAIKLAAPVMVALLAANVSLGIMARSFPQMNIFMMSLPVNIGVGFLILGMSLLVFLHTLQTSYAGYPEQIRTLFKILAERAGNG